ncbi:MAG: hypothetical protein ACI8P9_004694 [Parasphingorhabdus sp.]
MADKRLSLTPGGHIRYQLKTPYRNDTTYVIFGPLDFMAKLVLLVPIPRVNLTRYHGVFAPNSKYRALVTPVKRGKVNGPQKSGKSNNSPIAPERRAGLSWAQRLKRVFNIDIESCSTCCGTMKVIASIEDPVVIHKILDHLDSKTAVSSSFHLPDNRAPPQADLFH